LSYKKNLRLYVDFIDKQGYSIEQATAPHVRAFLSAKRADGANARSMNQTISTLRSFYKFLIREGFASENPMQQIKFMRVPRQLPTVVPEDKLCSLLDGNFFDSGFKGIRDQLVMEILFSTGMRRAELIAV